MTQFEAKKLLTKKSKKEVKLKKVSLMTLNLNWTDSLIPEILIQMFIWWIYKFKLSFFDIVRYMNNIKDVVHSSEHYEKNLHTKVCTPSQTLALPRAIYKITYILFFLKLKLEQSDRYQ